MRSDPDRLREPWRLSTAMLLSLLFHALLLSLSFGDGFGLPGLDFPWKEKRFRADDLRVVLAPRVTPAPVQLPQTELDAATVGERAIDAGPTADSLANPMEKAAAASDLAVAAPTAQARAGGPDEGTPVPASGQPSTPPPAPVMTSLLPSAATIVAVPSTSPLRLPELAPEQSGPAAEIPVAMDGAQERIEKVARERALELARIEREKEDAAQASRRQAALIEMTREAERKEAERQEAARQQDAQQEVARQQAARLAAAQTETERLAAARLELQRAEAERQEAAKKEAAKQDAAKQEAIRIEAARVAAAQLESARQAAARQELERAEAARQEAERQELARAEAARQESARQERARQEQLRQEQLQRERALQEAARLEAARQAAARQELERAEAARLESERQEAARQEAARQETARQERARQEQARQDQLQREKAQEAARLEAARLATAQEAARQEAARQEKADQQKSREQIAQAEEAAREARLRAIGRQLDEEAAKRDAAARTAGLSPKLLPISSAIRRGRLFGRSDPNVEMVLYGEAWVRKIQLNTPPDTVRELARLRHTQPLVTVAIRADGTIEKVTFVTSSGVPSVDEAIRQIVQNQAPYAAFSTALSREYDVIEIRRSWIFDSAVRLE
ncbi:TonB C-terminal domain-containing protein [Uliginosibacterium sp. H3]|uniref:TonB C-terminal domain-containing protein n=1 Tax=Uliginosibacterium silvisoli TaxID=3114758 RepID=A0ABU6K0J3_9RHOO|nr:TonB C-terminal domain-containing protein [Uliginosibacterium sp. H3]